MNRLIQPIALATLLAALALPAAAQSTTDDALARRAMQAILASTNLSVFDDVQVAVDEGRIRLTGAVTMPHKSQELERRVLEAVGSVSVTNDIHVLRASREDQLLRQRVAQEIYSHPAFWAYSSMAHPPIRIIVERGRVTLTGQVVSEVDRTLAYALAQVDGALGVTNHLAVDVR